jgi:cobalt-zinc-cadmium efflux system outer membrane protein
MVLLCASAALAPAPTLAQSRPVGTPLTLEAAVERALAMNPAIAAARLARPVHTAGLRVAAERANPEVSVEIEKETPKQSFGVALPLELGGKRRRRIAVSEATILAGEAELAAVVAQTRAEVRRAYFDLVVAGRRLDLLRELRGLAERSRNTAQTRFESGDAPRLEVLQAELALSSAATEATSAEGAVVAATAKLDALLGLPPETPQQLSTAIDAGGPLVVSAVLQTARTHSSELAVLDRRIAEQRARVDLSRALRVPDAVASATLTHDAQPEFDYGWRGSLAVTVPLFTTHRAGVVVEEATLAQLVAERESTHQRIEGEVAAAAASAEAQRQAYLRYRDVILPQAEQVEQLAQDSYRLGQTGVAALLQALQASRDVRLRALDAIASFQSALADLERAVGAPLR